MGNTDIDASTTVRESSNEYFFMWGAPVYGIIISSIFVYMTVYISKFKFFVKDFLKDVVGSMKGMLPP